jgi:hypothetical protein
VISSEWVEACEYNGCLAFRVSLRGSAAGQAPRVHAAYQNRMCASAETSSVPATMRLSLANDATARTGNGFRTSAARSI